MLSMLRTAWANLSGKMWSPLATLTRRTLTTWRTFSCCERRVIYDLGQVSSAYWLLVWFVVIVNQASFHEEWATQNRSPPTHHLSYECWSVLHVTSVNSIFSIQPHCLYSLHQITALRPSILNFWGRLVEFCQKSSEQTVKKWHCWLRFRKNGTQNFM